MTEHTTIVDDRRESGMGKGLVLGIAATVVVALVAIFLIAGGPGRFMAAPPANQTNVNVPARNAPARRPRRKGRTKPTGAICGRPSTRNSPGCRRSIGRR